MAEYDKNIRKKKFIPTPWDKEYVPRKPVILTKTDRENKDNEREKLRDKPGPVEKEKPPVIMIKAREPSTTKDSDIRAQSPKKITGKENEIEAAIVQNVKIAQNENKEKKIPESKPLAPPPLMIQPFKLIDDHMEFSSTVAEYLLDTNSNFLVVGVIGSQSVGKTTIMNILAHSPDMTNICEEILKSHEIVSGNLAKSESESPQPDKILQPVENNKNFSKANSLDETKPKPLVFKCQDMEQIETGQASTLGVDIYVTESRVILLDTGAVCGAGGNRMMGGIGANNMSKGGLEISAFLLAVCHVVILVQDWFVDLNMLRFIQSAEMVKPSIPAASNVTQAATHPLSTTSSSSSQDIDVHSPRDHYPHLLFLQNKCTMDDFNPQSVKIMQNLYKKAFSKSKMHIQSGMFMYDAESDENSCQIDGMFHNLNAEKCGKPVNLFLMPMVTEDYDKNYIYRGHPTIEELAKRLRWLVLGAARNQLTNVQLNERTWLQYCNKTWDNVKKSTFFIEYNRLLP